MSKEKVKKLIRVTTNNQVAIPAFIVRDLKLAKGSYLEVREEGNEIIMKPMRLVDADDYATYEAAIKKGRAQVKEGETEDWENVKKKLDEQDKARKSKT